MKSVTEQEYKVLMTRWPAPEGEEGQRWRAVLLGFPYITEEAFSREQAIDQIKTRIADILRTAEIITLTAPALPLAVNGNSDDLADQGWDDHGLFKDDPEALRLFDEVEAERSRHLVGGI